MSSRRSQRQLKQVMPRRTKSADANTPESIRKGQAIAVLGVRLLAGWQWLQKHGRLKVLQSKGRRLRVSETVSLGEKRFVSIVEVDGTSYLIGGGTAGVSLLTQLGNNVTTQPFGGVLGDAWQMKETA